MQAAARHLPLQQYALFHSQDVDETRTRVARIFCPHLLAPLGRARTLDACHHSALLHQHTSLNYVQYGPGVDIQPGYLKDFYLLQIPLRGGAAVRCGGQQVRAHAGLASLPSPTEPLAMQWADDSPHLIVKFARSALQQHLEQLAQAPLRAPLVFELGLPLDSAATLPLVQLVHSLRASLDASLDASLGTAPGLPSRLLAQQAEAYLMSGLLLCAQHNHSAALHGTATQQWLPRSVRRAEDYLASRLDQPVSLADLCQHVGVSARALQAAFRQHRGEGPMSFWRNARLDQVRETLRAPAAQTGSARVAEVAARYGFLHPGRFAADYKRRFGEAPSHTLARAGL